MSRFNVTLLLLQGEEYSSWMAGCSMTTKGRPLAKDGYEAELDSINTFLALKNTSDVSGTGSAPSQAEIKPEDLVGPHILKKHKSKKVRVTFIYNSTCVIYIHCNMILSIVHEKILVEEKLVNLAIRESFAKIFLANIHRYTENIYGICTDCCLFTKFFLTKYFLCTVY